MDSSVSRAQAKHFAIHRGPRSIDLPKGKVTDYYGENSFNLFQSSTISEAIKQEILQALKSGERLKKETFKVIAEAVTRWALQKGATHYCHWFQPLTGTTAEKQEAFLRLEDEKPIETLKASELMQGEPDASSFPNGGARSTFEARGYTSWDITSPLFIMEGPNGKTLCIPTAFVSYNGDALDVKTPLVRSTSKLNNEATKFLNLIGEKDVESVKVNCGCEQEYFLIDKSFYFLRPDLAMTGRTLLGSIPSKNQQLSDHYFGTIAERVQGCMQEIEVELFRLGVPAKTRHNEVSPGQYELAPIFRDANVASDNAQLVMATIKKVARKHNFIALLHEKPFAEVNGNGKHMNWSMETNTGKNLLSPGEQPQSNFCFLAVTSVVLEAVHRHADALRMAISGAGNDHRLGANEAPPSVISVFLGDTLGKIFDALADGKTFSPETYDDLQLGSNALVNLAKDNTDRNRTSPFAFTGNKFEFRAVGGPQNVGFPLTILNTAVASVFADTNNFLEGALKDGKDVSSALSELTQKWAKSAKKVIFNGDGYSDAWLDEASKRGLPNLRTTADALCVLRESDRHQFLIGQGVFSPREVETVHNVLLGNYNTIREIEYETLVNMVSQFVMPSAIEYKNKLGQAIADQKQCGLSPVAELETLKELNDLTNKVYEMGQSLKKSLHSVQKLDEVEKSNQLAHELLPKSELLANACNQIEDIVPDELWALPKYYDMLFVT